MKKKFPKYDRITVAMGFAGIGLVAAFFNGNAAIFFFGSALGSFVSEVFYQEKTESTVTEHENASGDVPEAIQRRLTRVKPKKQRKSKNENINFEMTTDQFNRLRQRIVEAMNSGEIIHIKYWGGSTPGEFREIAPIEFSQTGLLMAVCHRDSKVKSFKLEKIEFEGLEAAA